MSTEVVVSEGEGELVLARAVPAEQHPAVVYLAGLSKSSRR